MLQRRFTSGVLCGVLFGLASSANAVVVQTIETVIAPAGPSADTPYTPLFAAGAPSNADILAGKLPIQSNGSFFQTGSRGPLALTNGSVSTYYGAGLNEDIHTAYLSAGNGDSVTYALGGAYDISSVVLYGGWGDGGRDAQHYELQYSTDGGRNFVSLTEVDINPGVQGTDVTPVSSRVAVTENALPALAQGVTTVRVNFLAVENSWTGYTEIDVFGSLLSTPGDADGNGVVNDLDFNLIVSNFKSTPSLAGADGDVNYDDYVDQRDVFMWRDHAGLGSVLNNGAVSVPEPGTVAIVALLSVPSIGVWLRSRRR